MRETNRRQIGSQYEELAACFLERKGYRILEKIIAAVPGRSI